MKRIALICSVLLLTYVVLRAILVPFTHDEAWSYLFYMKGSLLDIVTGEPANANNHILNTLLAKFFLLFSSSEFSLRLPNVLAFCLYIFSTWKIANLLFKNKFVWFCFFISMLANHTLISFFSLCRGYGLGISLLIFSLYLLIFLFEKASIKSNEIVHLCLLSSGLAMCANFSLIVPVACIFGGVVVYQAIIVKKNWLAAIFVPAIYSIPMLLFAIWHIGKLVAAEQLYFGGDQNFIDDTLYSLMQDMVVDRNFAISYRDMLMVPFVVCIIISITATLFIIITKRKHNYIFFIPPLFLACCILFINMQFYLMHTKLLISRTALYLYPLIVLSAFSFISLVEIKKEVYKKWIIALMCIPMPIVFLMHANLHKPVDVWSFDASSEDALTHIMGQHQQGDTKVRVFSHWLMNLSMNYYTDTKYKYSVEPLPYTHEDTENIDLTVYDYLYLRNKDVFKNADRFELIASFQKGKLLLYKNKQKLIP